MREADPITQTLAIWLLYLALAAAGISQLPRVAEAIRYHLQQPTVMTTRKVTL